MRKKPQTGILVYLFLGCGGERKKNKELDFQDFPGGPVVKHPPSNAGDQGSIPGQGTKIPHAAGQLSLHTATREKPPCHNEDPAC